MLRPHLDSFSPITSGVPVFTIDSPTSEPSMMMMMMGGMKMKMGGMNMKMGGMNMNMKKMGIEKMAMAMKIGIPNKVMGMDISETQVLGNNRKKGMVKIARTGERAGGINRGTPGHLN